MKILLDGSSALDVVESINPKYILALCGSTLFLELQGYQYEGKMIAWGFDELSKSGCLAASELKKIHINIGTYSK